MTSGGLTVSTPAQEYFKECFDAFRDAVATQRDNISKFEPLPDVVTCSSATQANYHLTTKTPRDAVDVFDAYLAHLDEFKEAVDRAIKEIQAQDQA